ncbi:MAG TPA: hypothetical protein VGQ83_26260 [Polyangia bacterium]|jgi:hypothetical protein
MRVCLKATMPVEAGNAARKSGQMEALIEQTIGRTKPEAIYFMATGGERSFYCFFDLKDPSDIPSIAEPLFAGVNARIEVTPCMNLDDLRTGLQRAPKPK